MTLDGKKLIICGTGRSGTTLLMRILTAAGMDTGFGDEEMASALTNVGRAGLEIDISSKRFERTPQVIKSPWLVDSLPQILSENWFDIGLALIPVRALDAAAASRVAVHERALAFGEDPRIAPGGLWKTNNPEEQKAVLAEQFFRTVETLVTHGVPIQFTSFPRFAKDIGHFDETVAAPLEAVMGFNRSSVLDAYKKECRLDLISGFAPPEHFMPPKGKVGIDCNNLNKKSGDCSAQITEDRQIKSISGDAKPRFYQRIIHWLRNLR